MTRYLIADAMLFDDEVYEISTYASVDDAVILGAAASRCFATLLEAQGEIVTKKELLHAGWERYGQQVSANSVNQSIAQIRRCLSNLGNPDYVVTVPRIGYKICDGLSITKIGCSTVIQGTKLPGTEQPSQGLSLGPIGDAPTIDSHEHTGTHPFMRVGQVVILLVNLGLALGWYVMQMNSPLSTAVDFNYVSAPNNQFMHLFVAPSIYIDPERLDIHLRKLKLHPPSFISIADYGYVYFNGTLRDEAYSYFLCRGPIEFSRSRCFSYFVVDDYKP